MKPNRTLRLTLITVLASSGVVLAQDERPRLPEPKNATAKAMEPARPTTSALERAWPNQAIPSSAMPRLATSDEVAGWEVHSRDGKEVGTLSDFAIDVNSGKIAYAIVKRAGVLGVGGGTHAVPFSGIDVGSLEERTLTLKIDEEQWSEAPEFDEDELDQLAGTEERRRLHAFYAGSQTRDASSQSQMNQPHDIGEPQLRLASELKEAELHHRDTKVGEGDAVLVNLMDGEAFLRIGPDASVVGTNEALVLTFKQLRVDGEDNDRLQTTLSLQDLQRGRPGLERTRAAE